MSNNNRAANNPEGASSIDIVLHKFAKAERDDFVKNLSSIENVKVVNLPTKLTQQKLKDSSCQTVVVCTDSKAANSLSETIRNNCSIVSIQWLNELVRNQDIS